MKKSFVLFILAFSIMLLASCKNEKDAAIFYTKALECYQKQDFDKGIEYADMCLKKSSDFYQAKLLKAKILYFSNKNVEALKVINSLVKKYPEFSDARIWKIRLLISLDRYDEAEKFLIRELSFNNTDWRVYYQYAILAEKIDQMDKRIVMLNKAELYLSESYNVYVESADSWIKLGMRNEALDELDKAICISQNPEQLEKLRFYLKQGEDIQ